MIRNERGYALLLVVFMILLFTLLGVSILAASLGGAVRTETKENDVQSLHLAEKALNEAVSYLVSEYNGRSDISPEELQLYMDRLKNMEDPSVLLGEATSTEIQGARAQITDITVDEGNNDLSYKLTLKSEANVNGVVRTLVQEVYIDSYPEFLRYSYGAEQDVILNGSPYAIGNVYAGHELKINNRAQYIYNSERREWETQYPQLKGKLFVPSLNSIKYYDYGKVTVVPEDAYTSIPTDDPDKLEELLGLKYEDIQIKDASKFISINVDESFLDKAAEAAGNGSGVRDELKNVFDTANLDLLIDKLASKGIRRVSYRPEPPLPNWDNEEEVAAYEAAKQDYEDNYMSIFNSALTESIIFDDDLTLDGVAYKQLTYGTDLEGKDAKENGKWFIVNGDLKIDNYSNEDLVVKANILVTGNVTIIGKRIRVDSTIFCLGASAGESITVVQDAELKGVVDNKGQVKQLVLISKPDILLNRFEAFTNYGRYEEPAISKNRLDAFFYTEGEAELYGVGSTFWLNGGFFAKQNLTINAVLGNVTEKSDKSGISFNTTQMFADELDSRFIIEYDNKIFEEQYSGLPRVKQISVILGGRKLQHD